MLKWFSNSQVRLTRALPHWRAGTLTPNRGACLRTARTFLLVDIAPTGTDRAGLSNWRTGSGHCAVSMNPTEARPDRRATKSIRLPESANTDDARGSHGMVAYAVSKMLALHTPETVQGYFTSK